MPKNLGITIIIALHWFYGISQNNHHLNECPCKKLIIYYADLLLMVPDPNIDYAQKIWLLSPNNNYHTPRLIRVLGKTDEGKLNRFEAINGGEYKSWDVLGKQISIQDGVNTNFYVHKQAREDQCPREYDKKSIRWALDFKEISPDNYNVYPKGCLFKPQPCDSLINSRFVFDKGYFGTSNFPRLRNFSGKVLKRVAYTYMPKKVESGMNFKNRRAIANIFKSVSCITDDTIKLRFTPFDPNLPIYDIKISVPMNENEIILIYTNTPNQITKKPGFCAKGIHFKSFLPLLKFPPKMDKSLIPYEPRHRKYLWFGSKWLPHLNNDFLPDFFFPRPALDSIKRGERPENPDNVREPTIKCEPPLVERQ